MCKSNYKIKGKVTIWISLIRKLLWYNKLPAVIVSDITSQCWFMWLEGISFGISLNSEPAQTGKSYSMFLGHFLLKSNKLAILYLTQLQKRFHFLMQYDLNFAKKGLRKPGLASIGPRNKSSWCVRYIDNPRKIFRKIFACYSMLFYVIL